MKVSLKTSIGQPPPHAFISSWRGHRGRWRGKGPLALNDAELFGAVMVLGAIGGMPVFGDLVG
jgi:hypothetical protein